MFGVHAVNAINRRLDGIQAGLDRLETSVAKLLKGLKAMHDEINAKLDLLDKATNDIAARIAAISAQIGGGLTKDEAVAVAARLDAEVAKLQGLAADPNNPVPPG